MHICVYRCLRLTDKQTGSWTEELHEQQLQHIVRGRSYCWGEISQCWAGQWNW